MQRFFKLCRLFTFSKNCQHREELVVETGNMCVLYFAAGSVGERTTFIVISVICVYHWSGRILTR